MIGRILQARPGIQLLWGSLQQRKLAKTEERGGHVSVPLGILKVGRKTFCKKVYR